MSNEIKNTLFRFVTMRAPELSNEKNKNKRFIFRGEKLKENQVRPFDHAVKIKQNSTSKWNAMKTCSFDQAFTDEKVAKTFNESFYDLGIWIARNKNSYTTTDLLAEIKKLGIENELNIYELDVLWNNLFYQVITQKDFHVKESVMQMLIANHVYANRAALSPESSSEVHAKTEAQSVVEAQSAIEVQPVVDAVKPVLDMELINYIVNAKVVLPKDLFVEEETTTSVASKMSKTGDKTIEEIDVNQPMESLPSNEMKRVQDIVSAQTSIERNNLLKKELERAEKRHRKEYQTTYNKAQEEYQERTKPILAKYNEEVRNLKEKWCSVRDPKIPYDSTDPCNQIPTITQPELPKFQFEFRNEMDLDYLKKVLSEGSFTTLLELLEIAPAKTTFSKIDADASAEGTESNNTGPQDPYLDYGDYGGGSYSDTYTQIGNSNSQNTQVIVNNTPSQSTTSVSIGGVIVPLATTSGAAAFSYQICPKQTNTGTEFYLTIELPDSTLDFIPSSSYVQLYGGSGGIRDFSLATRNGNSICLKTSPSYPITDELTATKIEGSIKFSNGMIKTFSIPTSIRSSIFRTCFSGDLIDKKGSSTGSNTSSNTAVETFIPSGFGVKQLGIADYKKVEQTVQGYVEGDVAAIENIMAREYKEKATRKLRRSENTTTSSSESEREQLSDTTSTSRFEMQSEVASVLQEAKDFSAGAGVSYKPIESTILTANVNMGAHSSKEESNRQAITQAKDVTERAMERIVTKVKQERIEKIVEEFEENNKHGFDNTKGDKHIVGVYRWVDKIYKNQVLNFGKRLMFEFMVPEPAKLHLLGMTENKGASLLTPPTDPRKYKDDPNTPISSKLNLEDYSCINDFTVKYWGSIFNAELKPMPASSISIGKSFSGTANEQPNIVEYDELIAGNAEVTIPENYYTVSAKGRINAPNENAVGTCISVGGKDISGLLDIPISKFIGSVPVSFSSVGYHAVNVTFDIKCELSTTGLNQWKQETFKAIIDAYNKAVIEYNQKLAEEGAKGNVIKGENPGFYRQFENLILRKNCISYIISQNEDSKRTYGRDMFKPTKSGVTTAFNNLEVNVGSDLDDYAAFAKFIEQAFEWDIMSYNFYPYYWGAKKDWAQLYQYDNNDPLFRNFMQAGMARVVVTVRQGFEEAVSYYMQTGQIWNGGEVPVIEDKLFMSIVDELRQIPGKKEGKAWATRLPTALTILQADSIGLKVTKALPYDDDLSGFEDPSLVPHSLISNNEEAQLNGQKTARLIGRIEGNENIEAKITLKNIDGSLRDLTYCDANGDWELTTVPTGKYELLLDTNNDFDNTFFEVLEGHKQQVIELTPDQTLEVNLKVHKL